MKSNFKKLKENCDLISQQIYKNVIEKDYKNKQFGGSNKSLILPFAFMTSTNKRQIGPFRILDNELNKIKTEEKYSQFRKLRNTQISKVSIFINEKNNIKINQVEQNYFKQYTVPIKNFNFVKLISSKTNSENQNNYIDTTLFKNVKKLYTNFDLSDYEKYVIDLITFINFKNEIILISELKNYKQKIREINYSINIFDILKNNSTYFKFCFFYFIKMCNDINFSYIREEIIQVINTLFENKDNIVFIEELEIWIKELMKKYEDTNYRNNLKNGRYLKDNRDSFIFAFRTYNSGSINFKQIQRHFMMFNLANQIDKNRKIYDEYEEFNIEYKMVIIKYFELFINKDLDLKKLHEFVNTIYDQKYLDHIWNSNFTFEKANRNINFDLKNKIRLKQNNICIFHENDFDLYMKNIYFLNKNKESYLEFHHIIPHYYSQFLKEPELINQIGNIIGLCSLCHDKIHYSIEDESYQILISKVFNTLDDKFIKKIYDSLLEEEKIFYSNFEDFKQKLKYL